MLNHITFYISDLSNAQRRLSHSLVNFKFECIGNNQTEDEMVIANSLREFGKLIAAIEDEKDRLLDRAFEQFIVPLENFRKEHIGAVKERKKKFEKQTAKFCASQEKYLALSTKKQDTLLQEVKYFWFCFIVSIFGLDFEDICQRPSHNFFAIIFTSHDFYQKNLKTYSCQASKCLLSFFNF